MLKRIKIKIIKRKRSRKKNTA